MRESRQYSIKDRVFSKAILLAVGNALFAEYSSSVSNKSHCKFAFKISCADGTSYESESLELLADGSMIDIKSVEAIDIDYYDYTFERYANFSITHGDSYHNALLVRGDDSNWVNGIFVRIREVIDAAKPQESYFLKHRRLFFQVFALGTGSVAYAIVYPLVSWIMPTIQNPSPSLLAARSFLEGTGSSST